jgi:hypothetical protein
MFERLTRWENNDKDVADLIEEKSDFDGLTEAINRLAAYEDSGLSPEEVQELAQTKAEGRLVVLPCKVRDTVYEITREDCDYEDCPDEYHDRVDEVYIDQITCEIFENEVEIKLNDYLDIKDVYPTYEAAEKALGGAEG